MTAPTLEKHEKVHVTKIGDAKFQRAVDRAWVEVRQDGRLIGMDKLRDSVAQCAALRATGLKNASMRLPGNAGRNDGDILPMLDGIASAVAEKILRDALAKVKK